MDAAAPPGDIVVTRRRRALVFGVLAVLLGTLAATDVAGRERDLRRSLGEPVPVLVARGDIRAGQPLAGAALAVRRVPGRYRPRQGFATAVEVAGLKAAVAIPAGTDVTPALVADPDRSSTFEVGAGERVAELVAHGPAGQIAAGTHVDLLVTRETASGEGSTTLALQDAEVVRASPAPPEEGGEDPSPRVALALRVRLRDAVYLAAAQSFARELRVLPRAAGDREVQPGGLSVGSGLG